MNELLSPCPCFVLPTKVRFDLNTIIAYTRAVVVYTFIERVRGWDLL